MQSQKMHVLDFTPDHLRGSLRLLTRKELLEEALAESLPHHVRVNGEVGDLILLKARDVRKVDPSFGGRIEPVILVRTGVILVNLGQTELRALILRGRMYLIAPDGADSLLEVVRSNLQTLREAESSPALSGHACSSLAESLSGLDQAGCGPFEFSSLEALLMTACTELHARATALQSRVRETLSELRHTIGTSVVAGSSQLESMRDLKQQVKELLMQAQQIDRAITEVLEEDEDMCRMYLSKLHLAPRRRRDSGDPNLVPEHEEVELLLENYAQELGASISLLELLSYSIESDEKFVSYRLDSARNRLLKVDVMATIAATAFGAGSMVASILGMNLASPLFNLPDWVFNFVVSLIVLLIAIIFICMACCIYGRGKSARVMSAIRSRMGSFDRDVNHLQVGRVTPSLASTARSSLVREPGI